jgi:hypothetical protein
MFGFNRPFISGRMPVTDPRDPDYDDSRDDAIADEAIEGDLSMRHAPCNLLRALADFLTDTDAEEDAVRELLLPLYAEKQSPALSKLHAEFSRSDCAQDVAELALEREFSR